MSYTVKFHPATKVIVIDGRVHNIETLTAKKNKSQFETEMLESAKRIFK